VWLVGGPLWWLVGYPLTMAFVFAMLADHSKTLRKGKRRGESKAQGEDAVSDDAEARIVQ